MGGARDRGPLLPGFYRMVAAATRAADRAGLLLAPTSPGPAPPGGLVGWAAAGGGGGQEREEDGEGEGEGAAAGRRAALRECLQDFLVG